MLFQCKIEKFSMCAYTYSNMSFRLTPILFTGPCSVACGSEESFQQTNSGGWE